MGLLDSLFGGGQQVDPMAGQAGGMTDPFGNPVVQPLAGASGPNGSGMQVPQGVPQGAPPGAAQPQSGGLLGALFHPAYNNVQYPGKPSPLQSLIGTLGDALLVGSGHAPVFKPGIQARQQQSAMSNFQDDPAGSIHTLSQTPGGLNMSNELYQNLVGNQMKYAQMGPEMNKNNQEANVAQARGWGTLGGMASSLNANNYSAMMPVMQNFAKARGITLPVEKTPGQFDPDYANTIKQSGLTAYQSDRQADFGQQLGINQQNANTNAGNAGTNGQNADTRAAAAAENARHNQAMEGIQAGKGRPRRNVPLTAGPGASSVGGQPPMPADAARYPKGVNDGVNHWTVVNGQWTKG